MMDVVESIAQVTPSRFGDLYPQVCVSPRFYNKDGCPLT
jgi:hypothetical protein